MGLDEVVSPNDTQIWSAGSRCHRRVGGTMATVADAVLSFRLFPKQRIALVDEYSLSVGFDMPIEFGLGFDDALKATETLQMRLAYVGDEAVVGVGNLAKKVDFPRVVGAHFYYGNLSIRLDTQQGEWHTDMVVEVAHRVDDVVFLGQHCRNKFLGGSLAVSAGDAEHRGLAL